VIYLYGEEFLSIVHTWGSIRERLVWNPGVEVCVWGAVCWGRGLEVRPLGRTVRWGLGHPVLGGCRRK